VVPARTTHGHNACDGRGKDAHARGEEDGCGRQGEGKKGCGTVMEGEGNPSQAMGHLKGKETPVERWHILGENRGRRRGGSAYTNGRCVLSLQFD
jgi:hypothetical protein